MVGKEVMVFLKNGTVEPVVCLDFRIGIDNGAAAIMCQIEPTKMYVIPLSKIHHFDVRYVWIFDEPFFPPPDETYSV